MNKNKKVCIIPLNPKRKALRCKPKGATRPYTYAVKDKDGKVVKDEKGEIVYETIQIAMNHKERRANAPSYKVWKSMQFLEQGLKIMKAKMEKSKVKKEAKAAEDFKAMSKDDLKATKTVNPATEV